MPMPRDLSGDRTHTDVPAWELVRREAIQDCRVFQVHRAHALSPRDGATHTFFTLEAPDWVNVVPLTPDDEVVMVRQYRHGPRTSTLEIPGGMVDPDEEPLPAAARELLEETGYEAASWDLIGSVNPNPALFSNCCRTYLARDARQVAPIRNEGAEQTVVVRVPRAEIAERMRSGEIDHALVIAAFHWLSMIHEA